MKKIIAMVLMLLFAFSSINAYAVQTEMYIDHIDYLNTRTDNALVAVKLSQLPITTTNGNGTYGAGVIVAQFDTKQLKYVGIKTGSMVSSVGAKSIYWITKDPKTVNEDGEIRAVFFDSTANASKSYGEGSFEANRRESLFYLEFIILDKTIGNNLPITLVDGQLSGNVIVPQTATSEAIFTPSLLAGQTLGIKSGDISITTPPPTPSTEPTASPIPGVTASPIPQLTPTPLPTLPPNQSGGSGGSMPKVTAKPEHFPYIKGYPDGTFKTENNITRAETATIISRLTEGFKENTIYTCKFPDVVSSDWFASYIGFSQDKGVIVGYPDGAFKPAGNITRAEFATMIGRFKTLNVESEKALPFSDVGNHWSKKYLSAVYEKGYIQGYPNGTFAPNQPITRAEAVTIINRAIGRVPNKTNIKINLYSNPFSDVAKTHWAFYDILESAIKHYVEDFH